jgi:hypothetical protein
MKIKHINKSTRLLILPAFCLFGCSGGGYKASSNLQNSSSCSLQSDAQDSNEHLEYCWSKHAGPQFANYWAQQFRASRDDTIYHRMALICFFRSLETPFELSAALKLLKDVTWFHEDNVQIVSELGGYIPVDLRRGDTVFRIAPRTSSSDHCLIFVRVAGRAEISNLVQLFNSPYSEPSWDSPAPTLVVIEIAVVPQ